MADGQVVSLSIPCTNGSLTLKAGKVVVEGPQGAAKLDRETFKQVLKEASAGQEGLVSEVISSQSETPQGETIQMVVHSNIGDRQAGDWAQLSVIEKGRHSVHLQMGSFALMELRQSL